MHRRNNSQNYKSVGPGCSSLDSVIYWINHYPADSVIDFRILIRWIVIYPVDSAIQRSNNLRQNAFYTLSQP